MFCLLLSPSFAHTFAANFVAMKKLQSMKISLYQRKGKGKRITLYAYVIIDGARAKNCRKHG
jgi:hypothetical protein